MEEKFYIILMINMNVLHLIYGSNIDSDTAINLLKFKIKTKK